MGAENKGFLAIMQNFNMERLALVAGCLGMMRVCLAEAVDWAQALVSTGAVRLDRVVVRNTIGCLLKDRGDTIRFREELLGPLLEKTINAAELR